MLTTQPTLRVAHATVGLFAPILCCDAGAQSLTPEAVEQHVRARFSAWAGGDLVKAAELDSGAVGFGYRTRAARSAIPKSAYIEALRSFYASVEYFRVTLDELHTAVDGNIGLAWGFYSEDFKVRGREPEKVRIIRQDAGKKRSAALRAPQAETNAEHTKWIDSVLRSIQAIKPGMSRKDLLIIFKEKEGLSTGTRRQYVYKDCPYIKVAVGFAPVGNEGEKLSESPEDRIVNIS